MEFITVELIFIAIAYVVGTLYGKYIGYKDKTTNIVEATIDSLITDGYIKTRGNGENLELLKHWEQP